MSYLAYDWKKQVSTYNPLTDEQPMIHVIGAGALGSWLTLQLVKMGFKHITIWDGDKVELHNLPNQLYGEDDIGQYKAQALVNMLGRLYPSLMGDIIPRIEYVGAGTARMLNGVVFNCVDSMLARKMIYKWGFERGNVDLMIEDRLSIHGGYIYTVAKNIKDWDYKATLYDDEEAEVSECGVSQTVATAGFFISALMVDILISWLKEQKFCTRIEVEMHSLISMTEECEYI